MSEAKLKELLDRFSFSAFDEGTFEIGTEEYTKAVQVNNKAKADLWSMFRELEAERDHYKRYAVHGTKCFKWGRGCVCGLDAAKENKP